MHFDRYVDRTAEILERCRGQRVLHLGCIGFTDCSVTEKIALARNSLHRKLSELADCVGVDIDQQTVEQLRNAGIFHNILVADAERLEELPLVPNSFDVVLAGDIIEHLSNPGKMLDGAKHALRPDGRLIVSTPNSMGLPAHLRYVTGRFHEGLQHVLCFNAITLDQLLTRHGYKVLESFTCHQRFAEKSRSFKLGRAFFRKFPRLGGTLLFVARQRFSREVLHQTVSEDDMTSVVDSPAGEPFDYARRGN